MLNPFPELLVFSLAAPLLLRIVVGFVFVGSGWKTSIVNHTQKAQCFESMGFPKGKAWASFVGFLEIAGGIMLVVGFLTQIAAAILGIVTVGLILFKLKDSNSLPEPIVYYVVLLAVLMSLLFSGAGFLAFDLPL